jgi:glycosyltransferase involved in cell wall biosynthesis
MRVAFLTTYKSSDVSAWSGSMFNMLGALLNAGVQVETIDALSDPYSAFFKAKRIVKNTVFGKNYLRDREPLTLRGYARQVEGRLRRRNPDILFSAGTMPIAYLRTDKPIVFWADATFDGMINFYPEFTNLCEETIRNGHAMEQAALSNCRLAVYSSEWAAQTAIANYVVDGGKVKVVPYGANLPRFLTAEEVHQVIRSRGSGVCRLLFVGIDWYRKGGDEALLVTSRLNQMGLDAELHVVGCNPPSPLPLFVKTYGYLSKGNREHNDLLSKLYKTSDFFILPSKAECAAVVVAEANSFGLPALTTNVGGMGTVVRDGKNGRVFESPVFVQECADYIFQTLASKERYRQLCVSSFKEYASRLNWDSAVHSVLNLIASEGIFEDVKSQKHLLRE